MRIVKDMSVQHYVQSHGMYIIDIELCELPIRRVSCYQPFIINLFIQASLLIMLKGKPSGYVPLQRMFEQAWNTPGFLCVLITVRFLILVQQSPYASSVSLKISSTLKYTSQVFIILPMVYTDDFTGINYITCFS